MSVRAYCVQPFTIAGRGVDNARAQHFGSADEARAAGLALSAKRAGVAVYEFSGEPASGVWSEPRLLAAWGRIGRLAGQ